VVCEYPVVCQYRDADALVATEGKTSLDKSLTFKKHANQVSQSWYYHLKALRHIRHSLDTHTASLIAHALISSRLDYCNAVLYGAPQYVTHKLQRVQNSLARIVLRSDSLAHSEPLLRQLHWLPVHNRIHFKLATITYKALCTNYPQYLASHIRYHQSVRSLRSSDQHFLVPTPSSTNFGSRYFRSACHLELNTPRNPYISHHRHLQTQPKNTLLLLPSCLGHLLPRASDSFMTFCTLIYYIYILHLHLH